MFPGFLHTPLSHEHSWVVERRELGPAPGVGLRQVHSRCESHFLPLNSRPATCNPPLLYSVHLCGAGSGGHTNPSPWSRRSFGSTPKISPPPHHTPFCTKKCFNLCACCSFLCHSLSFRLSCVGGKGIETVGCNLVPTNKNQYFTHIPT